MPPDSYTQTREPLTVL